MMSSENALTIYVCNFEMETKCLIRGQNFDHKINNWLTSIGMLKYILNII